jgi:DNA-binding NtrC family response regulator
MAILVVDDDADVRADVGRALCNSGDGWEVRFAATAKEALALATGAGIEAVVLDYRLPDADGLTVLGDLRRARPDLPVVMITGSGSESVAVKAIKLGAADYVVKAGTYALVVPGLVREALGHRALARFATRRPRCPRSTPRRAGDSRPTASSLGAPPCCGCSG